MKQILFNQIWGFGVFVRNLAKRLGVLGPFEQFLAYLGPRLLPSPSEEVEVKLLGGKRMVVPQGSPSTRNYMTGLYETDVTRLFTRVVKEGMSVVDVGANIGYYTLLASELVRGAGRVYAFEADPKIYGYLQRNVEANACLNVVAVERAIANTVSRGQFVRLELERGYLTASDPQAGLITVEMVTLDHYFEEHEWPCINLVKMDIEGGELAALEGMVELSARNPGLQLIMEYNLIALRRGDCSPDDLAAILRRLGFCYGYLIERGLKPFSIDRSLPKSRAIYNLLLTKEPRA